MIEKIDYSRVHINVIRSVQIDLKNGVIEKLYKPILVLEVEEEKGNSYL